jgi:hypothetical protein
MLPSNTALILMALGYDSLDDFTASDKGTGVFLQWHHSDKQPTEQQISDWATDKTPLPNGRLFSQWQAENGGDPLATLRRKAKEALADQADEQNALVRAVVLELLDYCNEQRKRHNQLLQWIGGQLTLLNRGQLAALQLNEATPTQAKQAIVSRIENGEAD